MFEALSRIANYFRVLGPKGILSSLSACILKKDTYIEKHIGDAAHPIRLRAMTSDVPTFRQIFIYREYELHDYPAPEIIIDAGANIGLASIFFANKYPGAKIIAIEPEESNFILLRENTANYPNIHPLQAALWNTNEKISLVDPGLGKWGFMTESGEEDALNREHSPGEHGQVEGITVDKILEDFQLEHIDLLKIDIEGAEKEVFADTSNWLDKVDTIIVELHERMKPGCTRSFYQGTPGFTNEWTQGENVYLSRCHSEEST
ncbi:FkbM family methyltransferase [Pseudohalioglobus lutimaris]|uniref:FkbM family methyltransferase n=1 Tax=Pseudohalioglobus lutimaris TaxID=1737061 RepID=A0A2N5X2H6_9GAMM|nr:FkbM family methyltransferase [Pseudohalioglobus lutimaris]PLW68660.1 FkbM family methyltransferase [Pseudohalioglobus lutimaris]